MENENNNNNNLRDSSIIDDISKNNKTKLDKEVDDILNEFPLEAPKKNNAVKKPSKQKFKINFPKKPKRKFRRKKKKKGIEDAEEIIRQVSVEPIESFTKPTKNKKSNFNMLWPILGILIAIIIVAVVITLSCDCPDEILDTNSAQVLADSIQSQIITQGYADVTQGGVTLKLAPYTG